jgi:hypothetical protein
MDWSETIRRAAILAKEKGYITFDQLNELIPHKVEPEDVSSLMDELSANGRSRMREPHRQPVQDHLVRFAGKPKRMCFN